MKVEYPIGAYAPGHYSNKCMSCKESFEGDKYARQCEPCAINSINRSNTEALKELQVLRKALRNIEFSNDKINEVLKL